MSEQFISGTGKLYDAGGKQIINIVKYQIWERFQTEHTFGEWWGELVVGNIIWPLGEYVIELEDGRRGKIIITSIGNTFLQSGQTIYNYPFQGSGLLIQDKEPKDEIGN